MSYPTYPIYHMGAKWIEPIREDKNANGFNAQFYANRAVEGQPDMYWNGTSWNMMHREPKTDTELQAIIDEWWAEYRVRKNIATQDCVSEFRLIESEEWCLTWFSHETFDVGQSDEEALASFDAFLDRKGAYEGYDYHDPEAYCAMGAQDRWRWSGERAEDGSRTVPPCRCEGCKKAGKIRINH